MGLLYEIGFCFQNTTINLHVNLYFENSCFHFFHFFPTVMQQFIRAKLAMAFERFRKVSSKWLLSVQA